jgi:hypothetical protein
VLYGKSQAVSKPDADKALNAFGENPNHLGNFKFFLENSQSVYV